MESEKTTAATAPNTAPETTLAGTPCPMETSSPAGSKRGSRETTTKAPKNVLMKKEKGIEATKRRGGRKNLNERKDAAAVAQQVKVDAQAVWEMQAKDNPQVVLPPSLAEAMLYVKKGRIVGVAPPDIVFRAIACL
jgi:hypothetical protein